MDTLIETVIGYLLDGYTWVIDLPDIPKLLGIAFAGMIAVLGTFELVKKLAKLFFLVAVFAVIWYIDYADIFDIPFI